MNDTVNQLEPPDYRTLRTTTADYRLFSSTHRAFSTIDLMLGYKTSLTSLRILVIQSAISDHNKIKINNIYMFKQFTNIWKYTHSNKTSGSKKIRNGL